MEEYKKFLIELYTNLSVKAIQNGFPNGWQVNLSDSVIRRLNGGTDPKKVEKWAIKIDKLWRKML